MSTVNGFKPITEMGATELFEFIVNCHSIEEQEIEYRDQLIHALLTEEQREKIREIHEEFDDRLTAVQESRSAAEDTLKVKTLEAGETLSHGPHKAIYNKGRVSWDSKGLDGLLLAVPQLKSLRREGQPFVSIKLGEINNAEE